MTHEANADNLIETLAILTTDQDVKTKSFFMLEQEEIFLLQIVIN